MSDFSEAITDMTNDLLTAGGGSFVYLRGNQATAITLRKSVQQSELIDTGTGHLIEVAPVDFIGLTTAMPYDPPERGDRIKGGGMTFEVQQPAGSEKCFRRITETMTRIHTKQVG